VTEAVRAFLGVFVPEQIVGYSETVIWSIDEKSL
jgi:hypothetical protein